MGPPAPLHRPVMPLLLLLILPVLLASMAGGCIEEERRALLEFKRGFIDRNNVLASWNSSSTQDCCSWFGITCSISTYNNESSGGGGGGHVIGLNLVGAGLSGKRSLSLLALKHLKVLDLSSNKLGKSILTWVSSLHNLERILLNDCHLDGVVTEHHLRNLTKLIYLQLSNNPLLRIQITPGWVPPFSLISLYMSSCQVGPVIPDWIRTQKDMAVLELSNAGLQESLPTWIWSFSSSLLSLVLSQNELHGGIPNDMAMLLSSVQIRIDLSSNNLDGQLPGRINPSIRYLNLSFNSFSGNLSRLLCNRWALNQMFILDLDNNLLSGNMSNCWDQWWTLRSLSISNNNLSGQFSKSFANLRELEALHLRNNRLSGNLPLTVHGLTNLVTLDLSKNMLDGSMGSYHWEKLSNLKILLLDSNKFSGIIPRDFCNLVSLQIMTLASNNLSGAIPNCFNKLTGLAVKQERSGKINYATGQANVEQLSLLLKGRLDVYGNILGLVTLVDISNNHLSGGIPKELMDLKGLHFLNLSANQLTGKIPMTIRDMSSLGSLDLSRNRLSGEIPSTISQLTFLSVLNVSYNRLTGRIPSGSQLDTSHPSSFIGNALCGNPLPLQCGTSDTPNATHSEDYKEEDDDDSLIAFYIALPIGFGAGSSAVLITLLFRRSWRIAYFRWTEKMMYKLS